MKKLCCLFSYFHTSAQLVQISTHLKKPRPNTAKARVFCLLHKEVCTVLHFTFHARYWKHDWGRIHFLEFIWVFEFWDALGTLGFSVFCLFIGTKRR